MSKQLRSTLYGTTPGWQWNDGPVFVGTDGRRLAIKYGKTLKKLKYLKETAALDQERATREVWGVRR